MSSKKKTASTKEDSRPALVPKLRFPEFRNAEEWRGYLLEELEDLGWVKLGRGDVISNQDIKATPGDYPIYSSSVKNNGYMGSYGRFMFDEELISWSVDGGGDFFYRPPHKFSVTNVSGFMRLNVEQMNYRFTASQLQARHSSLTFDYQFKAHPSVIRKLYRLALPAVAEQQRIAECLSSVDEVIAAQARKVDALKTHKNGLMQQLFPREGETQPRLRFPEFQKSGAWAAKPFEHLANFQSGGTPSKANPAFWNGSVPWVSAKDMKQLFLDDAEDHISAAAVEQGAKVVPSGTILMLVRGMTLLKDVPICFVRREMSFNQDVKALRPVDGIDGLFLALMLTGLKERLLEMVTVAGHGTGKLDTDELKAMNLMLPSSAEQHRIASCLSSLDSLITAESQKLEALKRHKRGLMQQLFPSPEAAEA